MIDEPADDASDSPSRAFSKRRIALAVLAACLTVAAIAWLVATRSTSAAASERADEAVATVVVTRAQRREVPIVLAAPGTVTPFNSVTVRARIDGELRSVHFSEGEEVQAGQVLARIDPLPMHAALRRANANLRREEARLGNAATDYQRSESLNKKGFVTQGNLEAKRAQMEQARADLDANRGAVDQAALELGYTTVRSPISGRTGFRLIDPGSLVSAGERSAIVVVTQQQPIAVVFALPQKDLGAVGAGLRRGGGLGVELTDGRTRAVIGRGRVTTFDNAVDRESGTFQVKASLPNPDRALWPGQFVQVRLIVDSVPDGIVVPAEAVQRGPEGDFVFIVDGQRMARIRKVAVGQRIDGVALITSGLAGGEIVVVDGQYGLRSGMRVRVDGASGR